MSIKKSPNDSREYRYIELPNKMKVVLVSDNDTKSSACSMCVNVGYNNDPKEYPGLAHFLEHMLFMGSSKYPGENEYSETLAKYGGYSNAYTDYELTNYYFSVVNEHFEEVFDIFGQFFINPLFNESSVRKEIKAVNSEHSKNVNNDNWRIDMLIRQFINKDHNYAKFGTGNTETLDKTEIRDILIKFYEKHYSFSKMNLVILTNKSLDNMESVVRKLFTNSSNNLLNKISDTNKKIELETGKVIYINPIKNKRELTMLWEFPSGYNRYYKKKPVSYISHLIGHEGDGSILELLKRHNLANSLVAGCYTNESDVSIFSVKIELTSYGIDNIRDVISIVNRYIEILRSTPVKKWIFDEVSKINNCRFRFLDKSEPTNCVISLGVKLTKVPTISVEDIITSNYITEIYDDELIKKYINYLVPSNCLIMVLSNSKFSEMSKKSDDVKTEKWYGTEYFIRDDLFKNYECSINMDYLCLPKPNEFITDDFTMYQNSENTDELVNLIKDNRMEVWYKGCISKESELYNIYNVPKVCLMASIISKKIGVNLENNIKCDLYAYLLDDSLSNHLYDAEIADLRFNINQNFNKINLFMSGYTASIDKLINLITDRMTNLVINENRFNVIKEKMKNYLENIKFSQPYRLCSINLKVYLDKYTWSNNEMIETLEKITYNDLCDFIDKIYENVYMKFLVQGNITSERALELIKNQYDKLNSRYNIIPFSDYKMIKNKTLLINKDIRLSNICENKMEENNGVIVYYQIGEIDDSDYRSITLANILVQLFREPFFDRLRTKENFGYIVANSLYKLNDTIGIQFIIQSTKEIKLIENRIDTFINNFREYLCNLDKKTFDLFIQSQINMLMEKYKMINEEFNKNADEILKDKYIFNRKEIIVKEYNTIKTNDIISFYDTLTKCNRIFCNIIGH